LRGISKWGYKVCPHYAPRIHLIQVATVDLGRTYLRVIADSIRGLLEWMEFRRSKLAEITGVVLSRKTH